MAVSLYFGPGGRRRQPTDGDFMTAGNWLNGAVPDSQSDVLLANARAPYVVSLTQSRTIHDMSIDASATFAINYGSRPGTAFTLTGALTNSGNVTLDGAVVSGAVRNLGYIYAATGNNTVNGAVFNLGGIEVERNARFDLQGAFTNVEDSAFISHGTTQFFGAVDNQGFIVADTGRTRFAATGMLANLTGDTLRGGQWLVENGGAIDIQTTTNIALLDGAAVALSGPNSMIYSVIPGSTTQSLDRTLQMLDDDASLQLANGAVFDSQPGLTVHGELVLFDATLTGKALTLASGSRFAGHGTISAGDVTIDGSVVLDGHLTLQSGSLTFGARVSGTGRVTFATSEMAIVDADASFGRAAVEVLGDVHFLGPQSFRGGLVITGGSMTIDVAAAVLYGPSTLTDAQVSGGLLMYGTTTLAGTTILRSNVASTALVTVDSGAAVTIEGEVSGGGGFRLEDDAVLTLDGTVLRTKSIDMAHGAATLHLGDIDTFAGRVTGFGGDDRLQVDGFAVLGTSVAWRADADGVGGTLFLGDVGQREAIRLETGVYRAGWFHLSDAEAGSVFITYERAAPGAHGVSGEFVF